VSEPESHADREQADQPEALRSDVVATRARILEAAAALAPDRRTSMIEIAAAAGVGRSTLYRHFPSRQALRQALQAQGGAAPVPSERVSPLPFQPPGRLGRAQPLPLEVTHILDEVPPHLVADQLVAEARRAAGVPVALYVIDIDGSQLIRLAGSEDFPHELEAPPALGPEIVPEGLPAYEQRLRTLLPGCVAEPLWLRGRVLGLLISIGAPVTPLAEIAKQGAAALELANAYTDSVEAARRRKPTTAAAEIQQNLFPPRIARITGAQLAGGLLPSYEVGGDWFDFVENRDGAWLAIADAAGKGATPPDSALPFSARSAPPAAAATTSPKRSKRCTRRSADSATETSTSRRSSPAGAPPRAPSPGSTAATPTPTSSTPTAPGSPALSTSGDRQQSTTNSNRRRTTKPGHCLSDLPDRVFEPHAHRRRS